MQDRSLASQIKKNNMKHINIKIERCFLSFITTVLIAFVMDCISNDKNLVLFTSWTMAYIMGFIRELVDEDEYGSNNNYWITDAIGCSVGILFVNFLLCNYG